MVDFVDAVTNDVQNTWAQMLGGRYQRTQVVLFRDAIQSACGSGDAATGPFYCPGDQKVYLDLGFFDELSQRFGAPGDFAQAYVIAHEIGHHVQNRARVSSGGSSRPGPTARRSRLSCRPTVSPASGDMRRRRTAASQAGHVELEPGDAEEAMRAAAAIGDDRLQKMTHRPRHARSIHARHVRAARRVVQAGDGQRRPGQVRNGRSVTVNLVIWSSGHLVMIGRLTLNDRSMTK